MRNCGNCEFCEREAGDLSCANEQGEYFGDFVEIGHTCDDWSGTEDEE